MCPVTPGWARARRICSAISAAGQPFPVRPHAVRREPGPEGPSRRVLPRPPPEQRREALLPLVDRPVELRGEVVDPAALEPRARVRRDLLVRVESLHLRGAPRPPDPEGADAHAHVLLHGFHLVVKALHEPFDVPPAPVLASEGAPRGDVLAKPRCPEIRRLSLPRPSRDTGRSSRRRGCRRRRSAARRRGSPRASASATSGSPGSIQSCFP